MIADPNFSLALDDGWRRVPAADPALHLFIDPDRDIAMRLWADGQDTAPSDFDRLAWLFADREIEKALSAAQARGHVATIYEPIVAPQPWGRALVWHGHDTDGRRFGFSGIVTCRCRIGLALSTRSLAESGLLAVMDEIASRIVFDRTALASPACP